MARQYGEIPRPEQSQRWRAPVARRVPWTPSPAERSERTFPASGSCPPSFSNHPIWTSPPLPSLTLTESLSSPDGVGGNPPYPGRHGPPGLLGPDRLAGHHRPGHRHQEPGYLPRHLFRPGAEVPGERLEAGSHASDGVLLEVQRPENIQPSRRSRTPPPISMP